MAMDLVRPLGRAGIDAAVVARPGDPERFSRFTRAVIETAGHSEPDEQVVDHLIDFGQRQSSPPVLFYTSDKTLTLTSRFRERLREAFAFVIPDHGLVCDLVDKARFQVLAERLSLPVPRARVLDAAKQVPSPDLDLRFPVVIKPVTRLDYVRWAGLESRAKAYHVACAEDLRVLWPRLAASQVVVVAQEMVRGHENQIVSYHAYVDDDGCIVGEFTGRKIRTYPPEFGHTTALTVSADREAADIGRNILQSLGFSGVAKLDFKRGPDGQLHLLEINPRFSLWHHPGAAAGVNIPALVHGDLTGRPRPRAVSARPGTTWVKPWRDPPAARGDGISLRRWMLWALRADTTSVLAWDDPMPFLRGMVWTRAKQRFLTLFVKRH
jgi:predicted ATP-grasp superfamily ATP-dependent carboligase